MSTWQATPRGLALANHIRNQFHQHPCPHDCPICQDNRDPDYPHGQQESFPT